MVEPLDSDAPKGEIWIQVDKFPYKDINDNIIGIVGFALDITAKKKAEEEKKILEEQLQIRQRMDSLGTLAGGIAHDFNNLLQVITQYVSLLNIENQNLNGTQREYLRKTLLSCERAAEITQQLQRLSGDHKFERKSVDLYEIANEVFSLLSRTTPKIIEKKIEFEPGMFFVNANPIGLNQVLLNLATNSIKALEKRGLKNGDHIKIYAEKYKALTNDPMKLEKGKYVHIVFEDNGSGMPENVRAKIFEPLFTVSGPGKKKGQGLGLAMVYNIITKVHKGHIHVESEEKKGTKFHLYLHEGKAEKKTKGKTDFKILGGTETILLIDDEPGIIDTTSFALKLFGYKVLSSTDGLKGLDIYYKNREKIDIVISDLTMPRISGKEILETLSKDDAKVKVIISSGLSKDEIDKDVLKKASAVINKPYSGTELDNTIRKVLDS